MSDYLSSKGELEHAIKILKKIEYALSQDDSYELKKLSNFTIHAASAHQDDRSILMAVITYALSKIIERRDSLEIKNWSNTKKKIGVNLRSAIKSFQRKDSRAGIKHLKETRKTLTQRSSKLKEYIKDVLRKSSINKASRVYEHGISMERTASLLGITIWELSEYIGQKQPSETKQDMTVNVKQRAKFAMEFFEK